MPHFAYAPEHVEWYEAVISELDDVAGLSLENLQAATPLTYAQLASELEDGAFEERLTETSLQDYLCALQGSCFGELHRSGIGRINGLAILLIS